MNLFASVGSEMGALLKSHTQGWHQKCFRPEHSINQPELISSFLLSKESLLANVGLGSATKPALGGVAESCDTSPWCCHTSGCPLRGVEPGHSHGNVREGTRPWISGPDTNDIISCGKSHVWEQLLCFQGDCSSINNNVQRGFHRAAVPGTEGQRVLGGHRAGHGHGQRSHSASQNWQSRHHPASSRPREQLQAGILLPWLPTGIEHPLFCTFTEAQIGFTQTQSPS